MKGFLLVGDLRGFEKEINYANEMFKKINFNVELVNFNDIDVIVNDDRKILINGRKIDCPDFVLVTVVRERKDYHFKAVMRMFESMGVICINTLDAIERADNKLYSFQLAKQHVPEVNIPKTMLIKHDTDINDIEKEIGFPLVLKIMYGLQGKGVSLIKDKEELSDILNIIMAANFDDELIAQEAILSSKGKDIRVVIGAGKIIHSFMRVNEDDFKSNIHQGGYIEEFKVPKFLEDISLKLAEVFDLKLGSIDYLIGNDDETFYLCEINSTPGISYIFEAESSGNLELISKFMSIPQKIISKEK